MAEREHPEQKLVILNEPEVEGITPELLADLEDVVLKWGKEDWDASYLIYTSPENLGDTINIVTSIPDSSSESPAVFVFKKSSIPRPVVIPTAHGNFYWDKNLSAEEAGRMVKKIDRYLKQSDFINAETGERLPVPRNGWDARPEKVWALFLP